MSEVQEMTPYQLLGGEGVVRWLADRFYDIMDSEPAAKPLRDMHPADLSGSRQKLFMFLSGWLGGPSLYMEAFGHPRLRMRHMPFAVDEAARDQWMLCMRQAVSELVVEDGLKDKLLEAFYNTADFMRNR
ncbi:group II truncated hemoglobin [Chromobacterium amazonense]|uniref:Group II truncated hemoglobin n=1 Tax=Chromobacterium amazonense TaxID=1382803 RepID=A0ABU8V0L2_9NEIS|nr:group II truncated hemoglobin [Chromobacterium amazonense]KIA79238.1 hemoglobin-like protein [Chromobacterium piscinae]MBM2884962.1 group II truncated hemoglobin [Chromobacterium amazonense]MDE1714683.1 group II truncated hemoglobin [Chromobacterium amazonense]MDQ4542109.1 group II truncated hemoglobin [Chromobacterium amazonense]OHX16608.1 hemoglobin-like protein [Chromobacterium amazonense]